jgi:hypothetical protein
MKPSDPAKEAQPNAERRKKLDASSSASGATPPSTSQGRGLHLHCQRAGPAEEAKRLTLAEPPAHRELDPMAAADKGNDLAEAALAARARHRVGFDMTRKIRACTTGVAVVFAGALSAAQAQPPVVTVEDCGKTAVFVCADSGQRLGWPPRRMRVFPYRHARRFLFSYDYPTRLREWLWNDP